MGYIRNLVGHNTTDVISFFKTSSRHINSFAVRAILIFLYIILEQYHYSETRPKCINFLEYTYVFILQSPDLGSGIQTELSYQRFQGRTKKCIRSWHLDKGIHKINVREQL